MKNPKIVRFSNKMPTCSFVRVYIAKNPPMNRMLTSKNERSVS